METDFSNSNTVNTTDPTKDNYFENFCGACDNFQTLDCPFMTLVNSRTRYKEIGCRSFWD
jgi:hypothetical protein